MAADVTDDELRRRGLTRSDVTARGFSRRRCGRGFCYINTVGLPIKDPRTRTRLKRLSAPPAWSDVWYAPSPTAHIQAAGTDERGRRQYIYHEGWTQWRDEAKFARMAQFGEALPALRRHARRALLSADLEEAACAIVITLLDKAALRVGGEEYTKSNRAFGAVTLLKRHVSVTEDGVTLDFRAKGGKLRHVEINDEGLSAALAAFDDTPGKELFRLSDDDSGHVLRSCEVNAWIRRIAGEDFSAKDFRTFKGSAVFLDALAKAGPPPDAVRQKKAVLASAFERAAELLGNTPAICKSSYCAPLFADAWLQGEVRALDLRARRMRRALPLRDRRAIVAFSRYY